MLIVGACAAWIAGCSCGAISHGPDAGADAGGTDAASLDVPLDVPVPDVPPIDAPCIESLAVSATGTVLGSGAERFTDVRFDPIDCEGSYSVNIWLSEAGTPFDGASIGVSWSDASSLRGPDPVRGLDVPVSVVWGSGLGPGGSTTTTMRIEHADAWVGVGSLRFVASLTVDHGSDQFELSFDFAYCSIAVCL